jgi:hypothetical protein
LVVSRSIVSGAGSVMWGPHSSRHAITFPQGGNCYFPFALSPIFQPAD